jgi:ethanolamine utilization protein EutN
MQPARVIASARATIKHDSLNGQRLVLAQPLLADGRSADGMPLLVLDRLGAGVGQIVMLTSDAVAMRELTGSQICPARWSTLGVIDETTSAS